MRIAFFGGSFDPPHNGHLAIAAAAQQALALDTVLFAPVARQPLKPAGSSASFADRVAMTALAIANEPRFDLSLIDAPGNIPDATPNYTIDSLSLLRRTLPSETHLYLLFGADSFLTFPRWHRAAEIPFLADLVVASRPHQEISNPAQHMPVGVAAQPATQPNEFLLSDTQDRHAHLILLPGLEYDISATQLRRQIYVNTAPPIPPAVLEYIRAHHLYEQSIATN